MAKKILITGAGGFIGSHLAEQVLERGLEVRAFVRYNSGNRWGWLEESPAKKNIEVVLGDIRDYDSVAGAVKGCEAVFHLAALIGIPYSYLSPLAYIRTNVEGAYNVLQASREHGVSQILMTSTSETYGTAQYVPIDENHPLVGQSPYSASKIAADHLALSYHRAFDAPVKIVRPFNTYGPRQSARAVIPTIITQILSGRKELSLGNVEPSRDLTFVRDTASAFFEIFKADGLFGEVVNIGRNEDISIRDLALLIAGLTGAEISIATDAKRIRPAKSEVERLRCDNRKILSRTSWTPGVDLKKGLATTIAWIEAHLESYKADLYNV